ncbi:GTP-binding protein [Acidisphaera sp. L21]|uniref:CobW family GTP-binding protein n=1 Tax=Acidisphaera sp. L21 TaxID=1641851 RepID=UPI0020B15729|nr:GTP-binding protein [Acidisphaera sp. L21]
MPAPILPVPILLVTGFLGAGKTTLINHLLTHAAGRRLAAVVNDFGAIDIDAELLGGVADDIVSLKNGCICCSLQGDLLQTLSKILRRTPAPDAIVIETSGISDPAEIVRALLDPVIWREAALDTVLCLADAKHLTDDPALLDDPICRAQIKAADFVALNKTDLADPAAMRERLRSLKPDNAIFDIQHGQFPLDLLFDNALHQPWPAPRAAPRFSTPGFESTTWTSPVALDLGRFQTVIGHMAGRLIRAKGFVQFASHPGQPMLFQYVGERATIGPAPPQTATGEMVRLVLIARLGRLDAERFASRLVACRVHPEQPRTHEVAR